MKKIRFQTYLQKRSRIWIMTDQMISWTVIKYFSNQEYK